MEEQEWEMCNERSQVGCVCVSWNGEVKKRGLVDVECEDEGRDGCGYVEWVYGEECGEIGITTEQ